MPEVTAYHEAGHAFMAIFAGAQVRSVTITPDWDDGPQRHGDTEIAWQTSRFTPKEFQEKLVLVALAGPVAEMIHRGEPYHPGHVGEWADDWQQAWEAATTLVSDERKRLAYLEQKTVDLYRLLDREDHWAALAAIVDNLLAHERLESEEIEELIAAWLP